MNNRINSFQSRFTFVGHSVGTLVEAYPSLCRVEPLSPQLTQYLHIQYIRYIIIIIIIKKEEEEEEEEDTCSNEHRVCPMSLHKQKA